MTRERAKKMIRCWHIKDIMVGLLTMILGVIIVAVILLLVLLRSHREIAVGPVYLLVPIVTFVGGFFWSGRRSSRPKAPAKPPSKATIIAKSFAVGVAAMIVSVIAYFLWIWTRIPRDVGVGFVSFDVRALLNRPVLMVIFLAGFGVEYWRGLRRRSRMTSGFGQ
jgi:hypothetical protein